MLIRGAEPVSCFGLAGCDENAGTYALGWCLEQSAALRAELFGAMGLDPLAQVALSSQDFGMKDRGFTDLEVLSGTAFHLVFEAKRHWQVATHAQLARYVHRLADSNVQHKRLISVSAARKDWAVRHLPADVEGIPVDHLSWSEIRAMAKRALAATRNQIERLWLDQLALHLSEYGMTSNAFDSLAYVVSLSRDLMPSSQELTWIDVVTKQGKYFHPIGGNGWPTVPPAYIGFRYLSQFRSVHFIERVDTVDRLQDVDPHWPETHSPHFVYTLGPRCVQRRCCHWGISTTPPGTGSRWTCFLAAKQPRMRRRLRSPGTAKPSEARPDTRRKIGRSEPAERSRGTWDGQDSAYPDLQRLGPLAQIASKRRAQATATR